jgi:hypothetical protein
MDPAPSKRLEAGNGTPMTPTLDFLVPRFLEPRHAKASSRPPAAWAVVCVLGLALRLRRPFSRILRGGDENDSQTMCFDVVKNQISPTGSPSFQLESHEKRGGAMNTSCLPSSPCLVSGGKLPAATPSATRPGLPCSGSSIDCTHNVLQSPTSRQPVFFNI